MINDIRPTTARFFGSVTLCTLAFFLFGCPAETPAPAPDTTAPAVVALTATLGSVHGSVTLSWDEPADADFSHVLLSWMPTGGDQTQPLRVNKGMESRTITGLPPGNYSFSAVSVDGSDNQSSASAAAAAIPTAAASGATATRITAAGASTLTWTDPSPTTGIATLAITGTPGPTTAIEVALGVGSHTLTGLSLTEAHTFTITSVANPNTAITAGAAEVSADPLPLAMFALGAQKGGFGFDACETFRASDSDAVAVALRGAGYTKAVFFGSTPDPAGYSFINIATDTDALGITGATEAVETQLKARKIVAYAGVTPKTTFGTSGSESTRTIGNVLNVDVGSPADSTGAWQDGGYDVVKSVASGTFWSFTIDDTGGYSTFNCAGATSNVNTAMMPTLGAIGDNTAIDGFDNMNSSGDACSTTHQVLCVAH